MSERILELLNQLKDELELYRESQGNKRCWVLVGDVVFKGNVSTIEVRTVLTYLHRVLIIKGDFQVFVPPDEYCEDSFYSMDGVLYERVDWSAVGTEEECKVLYKEYLRKRKEVVI